MLLTAWTIIKFTALIGLILTALIFLFSIIHPLKFNIRLRTSIRGQRGEIWFLHFFDALKIGVVATRHTQDIVVKFLYWKYIIKRNQRKNMNEDPAVKKYESSTNVSDSNTDTDLKPIESETEKDFEVKNTGDTQDIKNVSNLDKVNKTDSPEKCETIKQDVLIDDAKNNQISSEKANQDIDSSNAEDDYSQEGHIVDKSVIEDAEAQSDIQQAEITEVDPSPIKLPSEEEVFDDKKKQNNIEDVEDVSNKPIPFRDKLRNIKKLASEKYKQFKHWFSFALRKWDKLKPILFRFWSRLKKGFSLNGPEIRMHYALHEHHITGMAQGSLSILSGMLQRFGIIFIPIPEFSVPMIYARGNVTAIIKPWRLLIATIGLLFELTLWKEAWTLGKWYWNNRKRLHKS